jgi:hypothetical protein
MLGSLLLGREDVLEEDRKDWSLMEKWPSLAVCLLIQIIPFQKFARHSGFLVRPYIAM